MNNERKALPVCKPTWTTHGTSVSSDDWRTRANSKPVTVTRKKKAK